MRVLAWTIYVISGFEAHAGLMSKLGKFRTGKSCLYVNCLDDIERKVLVQLVTESVAWLRNKYPEH